jgi:hypothetical protein
MSVAITDAIREIDKKIEILEQAKQILRDLDGSKPEKRAMKPVGRGRGPRRMSAKGRKAIADAQKRRWAAFHAKPNGAAEKRAQ